MGNWLQFPDPNLRPVLLGLLCPKKAGPWVLPLGPRGWTVLGLQEMLRDRQTWRARAQAAGLEWAVSLHRPSVVGSRGVVWDEAGEGVGPAGRLMDR